MTDIGGEKCISKWVLLINSNPNEIGDTLSGFAGSLAFLWIVVTVLIQSHELAAQREELSLTRSEFQQISAAQREQVRLMEIQTEMLLGEKDLLEQEKSDRLTIAIFDQLYRNTKEVLSRPIVLESGSHNRRFTVLNEIRQQYSRGSEVQKQPVNVLLQHLLEALEKVITTDPALEKPINANELFALRQNLNDLNKSLSKSGQALQRKFDSEGFKECEGKLNNLLGAFP